MDYPTGVDEFGVQWRLADGVYQVWHEGEWLPAQLVAAWRITPHRAQLWLALAQAQ